jgi:tetratricopeptide (TPR) repeat protein
MNVRGILGGAALLVAFSAGSAWAQYGTIRGKVVDDKGQPIAEAEVLLEGQGEVTKKSTLKTGKKGDFIQVGLPRGSYKVTISKIGFQPIAVPAMVSTGETSELGDIKLAPASGAAARGQTNAELNKAVELAQANDFDGAEAAFKAFLEKNPSHATAHYNLGYVLSRKKDWPNAEVSLKKAIELDPDMPQPYTLLMSVSQRSGKAAEAFEILSKAAAERADNPEFQYSYGVAAFNSNKSPEAHAAMEKVVASAPDNADAYFYLGMTSLHLNKTAEAVKNLEKYLTMSPTNADNIATAKALIPELKKQAK